MSSLPQHISIKVPATSANLGPGFDCLGVALSLFNQVTFTAADGWQDHAPAGGAGLTIHVRGIDADRVPLDETNLVYQTAAILFERARRWPIRLTIDIDNEIPVGSGLGSSSAAVVAGLLGANELTAAALGQAELLQIAAGIEGHPDNVAPAIMGGLVLGVTAVRATAVETSAQATLLLERLPTPPMRAVVVLPRFHFPTTQARSILPHNLSRADAIHNAGRVGLLVHALATGNYALLRVAMDDRLHQPYRLPLIPGAAEAMAAAYAAGAGGVALSGAGPSLIAFAEDDLPAIAAAMRAAFGAAGLESREWQLHIETAGAQLIVAGA